MKLYFAPMEGITKYMYRNIHRKYFHAADRYFSPFISMSRKISPKSKKDILPENNEGIELIPQIMVANSTEANYMAIKIADIGYNHLNINAGCPSGTVVTKYRGAGLLRDTDNLIRLLDGIFTEDNKTTYSIKLRLGWENISEWENISKIVGQYPFSEVIIHGRVRSEFYNGSSHRESLLIARDNIAAPLCYNGDINTVNDYNSLIEAYPFIDSVMIGRGILRNPGLFDEIITGKKTDNQVVYLFMEELFNQYMDLFQNNINTLYHMKELWFYLSMSHPDCEKDIKIIKKTNSILEYKEATKRILLK